MNFAAKHLPDKFYLEADSRVSLREKIFREIIANFLIHREYTNAHPATFIIYNHRVETRNPNRPHLVGNLEPGNFQPFPKNPSMAKFFVQMARAEDLGTGISNVFRYLKPYAGTVPVFREQDLFIAEVPLVTENVVENVVENETAILQAIMANSKVSARKIGQKLGLTERTVQRYLRNLQDRKKIERVGGDKGGHWVIEKD